MSIGIYCFKNKITGEMYIGQSIHIEQRYKEHLKAKDNSNFHQALQQYTIANFDFKILEECSEQELNEKEQYWIKYYDSYANGYNMTQGGSNYNRKKYLCERILHENEEKESFKIKWEDYTAAANELSPSALKLYMYLAKNQDGYQFWFSPKDYCDIFNLSDKTYRNAKNELMEKGYLKEESNNQVYFSASAAFRESIESLKEKLEKINNILDDDAQDELFNMLDKAKLKEIKNDENLYKAKLKEIVDFAEDLRANQKAMKLKKLL